MNPKARPCRRGLADAVLLDRHPGDDSAPVVAQREASEGAARTAALEVKPMSRAERISIDLRVMWANPRAVPVSPWRCSCESSPKEQARPTCSTPTPASPARTSRPRQSDRGYGAVHGAHQPVRGRQDPHPGHALPPGQEPGDAGRSACGPGQLAAAGLSAPPHPQVAAFVGNAWDPAEGRETPAVDIARQLAGSLRGDRLDDGRCGTAHRWAALRTVVASGSKPGRGAGWGGL